jgi:molybdenum cofactor guanylyltransferase
MPALLLDGSRHRSRHARVPERSRRSARKNLERWRAAIEHVGRVDALRRPDAAARRPYLARMNISAVLLAGGESRRMGKDKATLQFRGRPLWQIQLELVRKLQPSEIFISARTDPTWRPEDVRFVADIPPSRGPLSGIAASLAQMHATHLLALAIDMPFMSESYLRHLCHQIEASLGVVPKIASRAEPLAAIYPREAEIDFRRALAGADFSLQRLTRRLLETGKLREISVTGEERKLFLNVNELADLAAV